MVSQLQSCVLNKDVKKRILVIDDNADTLILLRCVLEDICKWDVITVKSGYEGLDKAKTETLDVIILDGVMPEMDAFNFLKQLRSNPDMQTLPVILLTACVTLPEQISLLDAHISGVIIKPFDPLSLGEQVAQFLGWTIVT
ncbi:response regulator [Anabaena sphaerica FACHB-251]|uniref:Response regulator n=1 Tax=Anabaena sphaerica FACHB-251 TaxID=2692883 RepID=A0A926WL36_9NOST|nr:response regulator [Anabaena sphaerica]MBD2296502.1 response regulator [Anabaena sphaerica FACHB-251]